MIERYFEKMFETADTIPTQLFIVAISSYNHQNNICTAVILMFFLKNPFIDQSKKPVYYHLSVNRE